MDATAAIGLATELLTSALTALNRETLAAYLRAGGAPPVSPFDGPGTWLVRSVPPLPASWPPDGCGRVVCYGFAYQLRSMGGGEQLAGPWARVTVDVTGIAEPLFETLATTLQCCGSQGVHPASAQDVAVFAHADAAVAQLCALTMNRGVPEAAAELRSYYALVAGHNPVATKQLRGFHPAFFQWLEQGER